MVRYKYIVVILILVANFAFAVGTQINPDPKMPKKEPRNKWGVGVIYSDKGYGIAGSYYAPISNSSDFYLNLGITGVSDNREFEFYDYYGNSYIDGKVNRVFLIPLNIGVQHYMFKEDIESDFKPFVSIGATPALVLTNPYDKAYFKAFGYFNSAFAMGGYVGAGFEYQQSKNIAFSLNLRYYYLPVVVGSVTSLVNNPMKDVGGIHMQFGVNFLK